MEYKNFFTKIISHKERGASITEFLILSPILIILILATMFINDIIIKKQQLRIAVRNINFAGLKENELINSVNQDIFQHKTLDNNQNYNFDIISSKEPHSFEIQKIAKDDKNNKAPFYKVNVVNKQNTNSNNSYKTPKMFNKGIYGNLSNLEGLVIKLGLTPINYIKNFKIFNTPLFFEDQIHYTTLKYYESNNQSSFANIMSKLYNLSVSIKNPNLDDETFKIYQNIVAQTIRKNPAYLPNSYKNEEIMGYILSYISGSWWGVKDPPDIIFVARKIQESHMLFNTKSKGFTSQCMMHFFAGNECLTLHPNPLATMIYTTGQIWPIISFILDLFSSGQVEVLKSTLGTAINKISKNLISNYLKEELIKKINDEIKERIKEEIIKQMQNLEQQFTQQIKNEINKITEQANQIQNQIKNHLDTTNHIINEVNYDNNIQK